MDKRTGRGSRGRRTAGQKKWIHHICQSKKKKKKARTLSSVCMYREIIRENRQEEGGGTVEKDRGRGKRNKQRGKERNMSPIFPSPWSQFPARAPCHREVVPRPTHLKLFKHPLGCFVSYTLQIQQDESETGRRRVWGGGGGGGKEERIGEERMKRRRAS